MNELEELRRVMRSSERPLGDGLDLDEIMVAGRRLRRRRRAVHGSAAALGAVLLSAGVAFGIDRMPISPATQPSLSVVQPAVTGAPSTPPVGPTPTKTAAPAPIGDVISTGIESGDEERVLYVRALLPELDPGDGDGLTVDIVAARRTATGDLIEDLVLAADIDGPDPEQGLHSVTLDDVLSQTPQSPPPQEGGPASPGTPAAPALPIFGYFVGPAARITTTLDGLRIDATLVHWSADPGIVIFWFDPDQLPTNALLPADDDRSALAISRAVAGIKVVDAKGRRL